MNRLSFNIALENRLKDVYEEDKRDAIEYYNELFDDMGLGDNDEIPLEYQNIDKIVKDIKADMKINRVIEKSKKDNNSIWKNILIILGAIFAVMFAIPVAIPLIFAFLILVLVIIFIPIIIFLSIIFSAGVSIFAIIASTIRFSVFPLGILGLFFILLGLSILTFKFARFIVIKTKDFVVRKLDERKYRNER